ncbi:MAG: YopT-type cysteine protease domain-containing protein, partial [Chloroflexota bacterium]
VKAEPKFWSGAFDKAGCLNGAFFGTIMVQQINPGRITVNATGKERDPGEMDASDVAPLFAKGFRCIRHNFGDPVVGRDAIKVSADFMEELAPIAAESRLARLCVLLGLKRANGPGGHAIGAMPNGDGSVLLMDPNIGEFRFPGVGTLVKWMKEDLTSYYDHYARFDKMYFCLLARKK